MPINTDTISVVVPVYHASKTIEALTDALLDILKPFNAYHIILVDDFSQDDSFFIIKKLAEKNRFITAIRLSKNYGQQIATLTGIKYAKSDYTVIIDDDMQQHPKDIYALYQKINDGYDVVYGVAENTYQNRKIRRLGSRIRDFIFNRLSDKPKGIKVSSFRIMTKKMVDNIKNANTAFIYISMEILKHTNNIGNVMVTYHHKTKTNYSFKKLVALAFNLIRYYSKFVFLTYKRPLKVEIAEIVGGGK